MLKPIIVFDLDGTLVDTATDLLESLNHCLDVGGLKQADPVSLRRYVGLGARVMIERAYQAQQKQLKSDQLDQLVAVFLEHYAQNMPGKARIFDGAIEALDRFASRGYLLAICTNKFEGLAVKLLDGLNLSDRFGAISGSDSFAFRKPDPRHLTQTIAAAGGDADRAVMIGDSRTDIDTAKAAGIPVVAVDFGYTDVPVNVLGPSRIISHYDELTISMVEQLTGAVMPR